MNSLTEIKPSTILLKVAEQLEHGTCSFGYNGGAAIWEVFPRQCQASVRNKAEEYFELFEPLTPILYWFGWGNHRDKDHCVLSMIMAATMAEDEGN